MKLSACLTLLVLLPVTAAVADTIRVPSEHATIQAAVDAADRGDTVLVAAGIYSERIRLRPGIILRSEGDQTVDAGILNRAAKTIIDGNGDAGTDPGVLMAEGCTLDGFTIRNVGTYDETVWNRHFESHGEELGDDEGSVHAEGTVPAVSIPGCGCTVTLCYVHKNGDVGISILGENTSSFPTLIVANTVSRNMGGGIGVAEGAAPIIRSNFCKENLRAGIGCRCASPVIIDNECFGNVRAGIGCREGSAAIMRSNRCYRNRRAGIGIRMKDTSPIVEDNECFENEFAGIGCRDLASPLLRRNRCHHNLFAGIGCSDGARPTIVGNECRENIRAGIGVELGAEASIVNNQCLENKLVAIGVTGNSKATILGNHLIRTGGMPPLVAVKDSSTAIICDNTLSGGGVAAVLVQGHATIQGNSFSGLTPKQGRAVWIWENSAGSIQRNSFRGYDSAVLATKASVNIFDNTVEQFATVAIVVKDSLTPPVICHNRGTSSDTQARLVDVAGTPGILQDNLLMAE